MKTIRHFYKLALLITAALPLSAFALGPIPAGDYVGELKCRTKLKFPEFPMQKADLGNQQYSMRVTENSIVTLDDDGTTGPSAELVLADGKVTAPNFVNEAGPLRGTYNDQSITIFIPLPNPAGATQGVRYTRLSDGSIKVVATIRLPKGLHNTCYGTLTKKN